jgi:hypothetical protein
MDIWEQFFIEKYYHEPILFQKQVPREMNPSFTLLVDVQVHHTTT